MSSSLFAELSLDAGSIERPARSSATAGATPSFWGRILGAFKIAREIQATREVNRYLARQPDRLLRDIGLNDHDISELRHRHSM